MPRKKYPSQLNSCAVRIRKCDYKLLFSLSQKLGDKIDQNTGLQFNVPIAKVLQIILEDQQVRALIEKLNRGQDV